MPLQNPNTPSAWHGVEVIYDMWIHSQKCIRREEGGGSGNQKFVVPKMAQIKISCCKFHFFPL